jgi:hypothetical protein
MKTLPFLILSSTFALPAMAQVVINELLASNTRAFADIVDFEDYPDWIELKNTTAAPVSLAGHFLSDDSANPYKWAFPAGASIPANGFLLVMADGRNAIPGEVHPRGYWPWRDFTTERFHANFALASEGETISLTHVTAINAVDLVTSAVPTPANASVWKFKDDGSNQSTQWRAANFDDSAWASGPSELGYADAPQTTVSFGASSTNKHITTYFRHSFNVASPALYQGLSFKLLVDDGAVVYLNGTEIIRRNLPLGEITYQTLASAAIGGTGETTFSEYTVPGSLLVAGSNVIAVEVHQSAPDSSDLSFDLSVTGNTYTGTQLDSVAYTQQVSDISYGRDPAAPGTWRQLAEPSPAEENTALLVNDIRVEGTPVTASVAAGVHTGTQTVTLSAAGPIRYTLDGSDPDSTSPLYSAPLDFTTTTILRARCFETDKAPGPILTRTYFIGETQGTLPYVSIVADPETLFGDEIGIYYNQHEPLVSSSTFSALGYRDVYKGKDAPGHVEFFPPAGAPSFRANVGIRIGGENNWVHPQKALNLAVRGKYGDDEIKYDLFPGFGNVIHNAFTLRDGGDRWANEMLRDCMWPKLAQGFMKVDTADYRPTVVFINGQYYGLHDLRERWDDTWFTQKYHIPEGKVDHLLYGHITSSSTTLGVEKGDTVDWLELMNFVNTADLTDPLNWAFVESRVDLDSFMDFVISESYGNNTSWFHNREFWKEKKAGAKWRWCLTDMDRTLSTSTTTGILADMLANEDLLKRLKLNTGFKQRLAQRYSAHMAATFTAPRVQSIMNQLAGEISPTEVTRHQNRWAPHGMTSATRATGISGTLTYATTRAGNVHSEIVTQLGVSAAVNLTLATVGNGTVLVQGVPVEPSTFKMFPNIPITLEAIPAPGFAFSGWTGATGSESTSITITGAHSVTASFTAIAETIVGGTLAEDTTLSPGASPYVLTSDWIIPPGITLTIPAGVTVRMTGKRNIRVQGTLLVNGTASQPVTIEGRNNERWGGISFENPATPSALAHVILRDATKGFDPTKYPSAISGLNANLTLDFLDIRESEGPIFCRGGNTLLRDSTLQNPYTGDCINIKQGLATTQRCTFLGNNQPDTDAIDYDGVTNGIIEDCRIYRFQGSNSDGIDIGEECSNVLIQGNLIYYNSDKGFSVGQGSTVTLRKNLVVGCVLGVGIKDSGSHANIDQNTFFDCDTGVAIYEKNFGDGGGSAVITNTIISRATTPPVTVDSFSKVTTSYSLSDTVALAGTANLLADPAFVDPVVLNFQLQPSSPAINSGDPAHALDPDLSIVDRGAAYLYQVTDYPYTIGETVVINEILSNSGSSSDWIELHNRTQGAIDISGWFLSDDGTNLAKYRIPAGTVLPAGGHIAFYEDLNFGTASVDPDKVTPFALSDIGETVYISSAVNNELTDYQSKEEFGASAEGETLGAYYKPSTDSYNFVAMSQPTPAATNSGPRVGPIVISEIMYNPTGSSDADEYIELQNISNSPVTLYDSVKLKPWRMTDGVDFEFPAGMSALVMDPGERVILTRNLVSYQNVHGATPAKRFQWTAGTLDNGGETVQIAKPGGVDGLNQTQYIRIDRVNYNDAFPWPTSPDGSGSSLGKIATHEYGNDFVNWTATSASPGAANPGASFASWIAGSGLPPADQGPDADADGDGRSNLVEYAIGSSPSNRDAGPPFSMTLANGRALLGFGFRSDLPGTIVRLEQSATLGDLSWIPVDSVPLSLADGIQQREAEVSTIGKSKIFFRMVVLDPAQ